MASGVLVVYEHSNARVCLGNSGAGVVTEHVYCYARVNLPHRAKTVAVSLPCCTILKECHAAYSSHL
eukprot:COSAG02_NODE_13737_length_1355_cov_83.082006_3_plen_67_part_00